MWGKSSQRLCSLPILKATAVCNQGVCIKPQKEPHVRMQNRPSSSIAVTQRIVAPTKKTKKKKNQKDVRQDLDKGET